MQFRSIYVHTFQFLTLVPEDRETFEIILLKASLYMFESMHNEFDWCIEYCIRGNALDERIFLSCQKKDNLQCSKLVDQCNLLSVWSGQADWPDKSLSWLNINNVSIFVDHHLADNRKTHYKQSNFLLSLLYLLFTYYIHRRF